MKISIVVPVYKTEKFLKQCVDSILRQTYSDYEIILVDDGSPDKSGELCDELSCADKRIKVIHQKNSGVTVARAKGVGQAKGEWVCFVDSDDTLPQDALSRLSEGICNETDLVIGFWDDRKIIKREWMKLNEYRETCITGKKIYPGPCARLIRRTLFDATTFDIPRSIVKGEDMLMNIRLAFAMQHDVRIVPYKVYNYLSHSESCVHSFIPTCDYEYMFYQERLKAIPVHIQARYKKLCIKNSLKALHRIIRNTSRVEDWVTSEFVLQLRKDVIAIRYPLSLGDRILLRGRVDFWTRLMKKIL